MYSSSYIYFILEWRSGWFIFWVFVFSIKFSPIENILKCLNHTDKQVSEGDLGKSNSLPNATFNSGVKVKSHSICV